MSADSPGHAGRGGAGSSRAHAQERARPPRGARGKEAAGVWGGRGQLRCPPPTKSTPRTHGDTKLPVFFQPALEPLPY